MGRRRKFITRSVASGIGYETDTHGPGVSHARVLHLACKRCEGPNVPARGISAYHQGMDALPPQSVEALLEALNCGAMLMDRRGTILRANQRLMSMLNMPDRCITGMMLETIYDDDDDRKRIRERIARFTEAREGEFHLPAADGREVPVILSSRPLGVLPPLSDYMVVTAIDISKQKNAEAQLAEENKTIASLSDTVLEQALDLKHYNEQLEQKVRARTEEIRAANMDAILMLAVASEARDEDTGAHVKRIQTYTELLARELGFSDSEVERFGYSAILHDVGKMVIPDSVLKKPGALTAEEREIVKSHTTAGERILSDADFYETARRIARSHHENWDGTGYPDGLGEMEIPAPARLVRLVDVFDALTSPRVYKPAWSADDAAGAIEEGNGTLFEPEAVRAFMSLFKRGAFDGQVALAQG